VPEIATI
jgi:hypothetical protein